MRHARTFANFILHVRAIFKLNFDRMLHNYSHYRYAVVKCLVNLVSRNGLEVQYIIQS